MKSPVPKITHPQSTFTKQKGMAYTARTASAEVLTTLAVLKVQIGKGQDYLQNFIPFVAECLRVGTGDVVTVSSLQAGFKRLFGFEVPGGVIQTLIKRAVKQGLVEQDNRIYRPIRQELNNLTIERDRELAGQELEKLVVSFQGFALANYEQTFSLLDAENALFDFISEHGVFALVDAAAPHNSKQASNHYLVGAFVEQLIATDPQGLGYFERAVQGSMLASVLHFENKVTPAERWKNASVYFDTPILLRIIGLYGDEVKGPYIELTQLLSRQGVGLHCFQHTLGELDRVLSSIEENLRQGRRELKIFEDLGETLLSSSWTATDVRVERGRIERKLLALGITAHELPRVQAHLNPDMNRVNEIFQNAVGYRNENAREHDTAAILAIHRIRAGIHPTQIERCVALFVTTNNKVVNATREVFREQFGYRAEDINACVSHEVLTTIAWLKANALLGVQGTLPRKQLVADAYAAMKPSDEVWHAYLGEIQKLRHDELVDEADVLYLRCAPEAVSALARLTLNDSSAYVEGTVEEVLEQARAANRLDVENTQKETAATLARVEVERNIVNEQKEEALRQVAEQQQQVAAQAAARQDAEQQIVLSNATLAQKDNSLSVYENHVAGRKKTAHRIGVFAGWVCFAIVIYGLSYLTWIFGLSSKVPVELQKALTIHNIPYRPTILFATFCLYSFSGLLSKAKTYRLWCEGQIEGVINRILVGNL